jgi:hypothetical protein
LVITLENAPLRDDCTKLTDYVISLSSVKNMLYVAVSLLGSKENTNANMTSPTNAWIVNIWLNIGAAVMGRKILSAIQFRAKTELKPIPSIYDEEISKLRDAP